MKNSDTKTPIEEFLKQLNLGKESIVVCKTYISVGDNRNVSLYGPNLRTGVVNDRRIGTGKTHWVDTEAIE